MGAPLARRLMLAKQAVFVFDTNGRATQSLEEEGAIPCRDIQELSTQCDVIFLCLPTCTHVKNTVLGRNGVFESARAGAIVVDQTTSDPELTKDIARQLRSRRIDFVDAPVSGGPQAANDGNIAVMVGACPEIFSRIEPILQMMSCNVFHAGDVGAGNIAKLANNLVSAGQRLITLEAMALAVKNGLRAEAIVDIMLSGSSRNFYLEKFVKPHVLTGNLESGFSVEMQYKDVRMACELGEDSDVPMFFGNLTKEFYQMTMNSFGRTAQLNTVALMMDQLAGTNVVPVRTGSPSDE
jgi:3-hydroxyisobutyrate dehydrogenase